AMPDIRHRLTMSAPRDEVFAALTKMVRSRAIEVGIEVCEVAIERDRSTYFRVMDGPLEWIGTEIAIELAADGPDTIVSFVHRHWGDANDVIAGCTTSWGRGLFNVQRFVETKEPDDTRV